MNAIMSVGSTYDLWHMLYEWCRRRSIEPDDADRLLQLCRDPEDQKWLKEFAARLAELDHAESLEAADDANIRFRSTHKYYPPKTETLADFFATDWYSREEMQAVRNDLKTKGRHAWHSDFVFTRIG